jgi:hypothetical protein
MSVIYLKGSDKSPQFRQKPWFEFKPSDDGYFCPTVRLFHPAAFMPSKKQGPDLVEASRSG